MSGRSKSDIFNQEELEAEIQRQKDNEYDSLGAKPSKHSLDSDEEDESEKIAKYNVLDPNDLEGQEEGTIDFDGEIRIMPFNMKEELESGHFDKDGTYIFRKDEDEVKDQWLDDIDWVKVKERETKRKQADREDSSDEENAPQINLVDKYKQMLDMMRPGETVQKAICRLGGSKAKVSASQRWKKKKKEEEAQDEKNASEKDVQKMMLLTRLADDIIQSGDMDVYEQTFEKMAHFVKLRSVESEGDLDMFGEEFEEKAEEGKSSEQVSQVSSSTCEDVGPDDSDVQWEFKWESAGDAKVYGPYTSSQMLQWVEDKYFEDGVLVRQVGKQDTEFYSSKRIDFDLYV